MREQNVTRNAGGQIGEMCYRRQFKNNLEQRLEQLQNAIQVLDKLRNGSVNNTRLGLQ